MRFFHTLREKEFTIKNLKRGNPLPLIKYLLYRMRLSRVFFVHRKHYRMRVWYAPLAFWLWTRENTPKSDELFYESFLRPGNVVIDCGAHLGTLAITASKLVGATGRVIACEMHPRTYSYLAVNVKENQCANIELHNVAIGDEEKTVSVTDEYVSDINHVSPLGTLQAPMRTIDSIAKGTDHIDLIKLDIEGYEFQALKGAMETLPKTRSVYFEAAPRNFARYGYTLRDILVFLQERGFDCYAFDEEGKTYAIDETYTPSVKYENILAIRPEAFEKLRLEK
jgi:FkbM family methyltransferase